MLSSCSRCRRWVETVPPAACFLSVVSVAEIRLGIEGVADLVFRSELDAWLRDGVRVWFGERILAADEAVLLAWRRLVAEGQQAKYTYSQPDALIAATALVHGLGVATRNSDDLMRAGVALINPWDAPPR